jgi:hypothetical protein
MEENKLDANDYAKLAKEQLREAYKSLLKAAEIDGKYEYKDSIKCRMLDRASKVIEITEGL